MKEGLYIYVEQELKSNNPIFFCIECHTKFDGGGCGHTDLENFEESFFDFKKIHEKIKVFNQIPNLNYMESIEVVLKDDSTKKFNLYEQYKNFDFSKVRLLKIRKGEVLKLYRPLHPLEIPSTIKEHLDN